VRSAIFRTQLLFLLHLSSCSKLPAAETEKPIWAKSAIRLGECFGDIGHRIPSPDGNVVIELQCHAPIGDADPVPYLRVRTVAGTWLDVELEEGAKEVLWSPDSKAFLVNGGTNAYAGFFASVYLVFANSVQKLRVTDAVQADMVKTFPPCKAFNRDEHTCKEIARDPEFNMSGLAWVMGSSAIIVMAEVPCSSSYGGIMCQVQGYQLSVPGGMIARRMTARELKKRWQPSMAWTMRIPEPPEYGPAWKQQ
jgi:hypothetical protein